MRAERGEEEEGSPPGITEEGAGSRMRRKVAMSEVTGRLNEADFRRLPPEW